MGVNLKGRNFLTLKDYSSEEIEYLVDLAIDLKEKKKKGFKKNRLFGKERKYDKELYREYLNMEHDKFKDSYKDYLEDEMEYHANKKF